MSIIYLWWEENDVVFCAKKDDRKYYIDAWLTPYCSQETIFAVFDNRAWFLFDLDGPYFTCHNSLSDCLAYRENKLKEQIEELKQQLSTQPTIKE